MKIAKEADMVLKCQQTNQSGNVELKIYWNIKNIMPCLLQNEVKRHEFFLSINWDDLEQKKLPPPFNPSVVRLETILLKFQKLLYISVLKQSTL